MIVLEARNVSVQYPGTLALDDITIRLRRGVVTALIGENGAGKSTLVKVLGGITRPTRGALYLDGAPLHLHSVRDADAHGIGIIHQELNLCPNLSIAENIFLGRELTRAGRLDLRRQREQAVALLARLQHPIHPDTLAGDLPLGQQQIVEFAKALARDVRVLMMDEPTSALSASEIVVLFRIIADLKARGVAIVYISHRLDELLQVADQVTVLRDGRLVAEAEAAAVDPHWIVEQMTGRPAASAGPPSSPKSGEPLLRVEHLTLPARDGRPRFHDVSLDVAPGEVLGLYGLLGAGRTELLEALMGLHREVRGTVSLGSTRLDRLDPARRMAAGLAMVPEDRQTSALMPDFSVTANLTLAALPRFTRGPWLSPPAEAAAATAISAELRIKHPGLAAPIGALSGGNQQKVVIGRCLVTQPRVLLLDEPTRGVDVGAKAEIHALIRRLAASGLAVVLVSSELEEIRAAATRTLVLSRGRITGCFSAAEATGSALALAASAAVEGGSAAA